MIAALDGVQVRAIALQAREQGARVGEGDVGVLAPVQDVDRPSRVERSPQ